MDLKTKREFVAKLSQQYNKSDKKGKEVILDKFVLVAGYHRKYAIEVLCNPPAKKKARSKRKKESQFKPIFPKLTQLWAISNYASGKRLVGAISDYLDALTRHGKSKVTGEERKLLLKISPATADRLLKHEREKITLKGRSRTKTGSLLKSQIPIHTFADWNNAKPCF